VDTVILKILNLWKQHKLVLYY